MKVFLKVFVLFVVLAGFFSCSLPSDNISVDDPTIDSGSIRIQIPEIASWLENTNRGEKNINSRALAFISTVEFTLYDSGSNYVDSQTVTSGTQFLDWVVTAGSSYSLVAEVYNNNVSTTSTVVDGISTGINVTSGATTVVDLTCFPTSPVTLSPGSTSSNYTLNSLGEKWFQLTANAASTTFSITSTGASDTGIAVFGSDGILITFADTTAVTDSVTISTTSGSVYYFVALEYSSTSDSFYVSTNSSGTPPPPDDIYEENDTLATAWDLTLDELTWITAIQADDDWYKIALTANYTRVLIDCRFTHAEGDIDIALFDASGNMLPGAFSVSTTDNEYIDYDVADLGLNSGTFYIRVDFGDAGNEYDLWWDDVMPGASPSTGLIDVSVQ